MVTLLTTTFADVSVLAVLKYQNQICRPRCYYHDCYDDDCGCVCCDGTHFSVHHHPNDHGTEMVDSYFWWTGFDSCSDQSINSLTQQQNDSLLTQECIDITKTYILSHRHLRFRLLLSLSSFHTPSQSR